MTSYRDQRQLKEESSGLMVPEGDSNGGGGGEAAGNQRKKLRSRISESPFTCRKQRELIGNGPRLQTLKALPWSLPNTHTERHTLCASSSKTPTSKGSMIFSNKATSCESSVQMFDTQKGISHSNCNNKLFIFLHNVYKNNC